MIFKLLIKFFVLFFSVFLVCVSEVRASDYGAQGDIVGMLSGKADPKFKRATQPMDFQFPRDHAAHPDYKTEWWYYTGNLQSPDGRGYGYQLTFFRNSLAPDVSSRSSEFASNQVYMAHFAVTDVSRKEYKSFERYSRGSIGLAGAKVEHSNYSVWLEDWSATQKTDKTIRLFAVNDAADPIIAIDLILTQTCKPVFHGNDGLSQKGPEVGNANHYYSLIGLESIGTVQINKERINVTGTSWMDHEFGTSSLSEGIVGWDWFSIQLDNDVALMLARLRFQDGTDWQGFQGSLIQPNQPTEKVSRSDFIVQQTSRWKSPKSGNIYPSGWVIKLDRFQMNIQVEPMMKDQEFEGNFKYWEGAVRVKGTFKGKLVEGAGYVELTGYKK